MRIVKAIENMTASNRKLMYMCNTRPVLKTGALFRGAAVVLAR